MISALVSECSRSGVWMLQLIRNIHEIEQKKKTAEFSFKAQQSCRRVSDTHACSLMTCKQHGCSSVSPSGRLGAVSTILFTLWIPRTPRLGPAVKSFWCVFACVCVCGVALYCLVCVCVVTWWACGSAPTAGVCVCVCVCGSVEARLNIMGSGSQRGDMDHHEGVQFSPKNLSRSQDGVKESLSNVCYSVRCCC